jgi:hypothetical protein
MQTLEAGGSGDPHSPGNPSCSQPVSDKVRDITSTVLQEGVDSKRTLDKMKSIGSKSLNRGLDNVSLMLVMYHLTQAVLFMHHTRLALHGTNTHCFDSRMEVTLNPAF